MTTAVAYSGVQWLLIGAAATMFFLGNAVIAAKVSRRESVSFWMLMLGLKRNVRYTGQEKTVSVLLFVVPLALIVFAMQLE